MSIKAKWLQKKIHLTEKEIAMWESKSNTANVSLRQQKEKLWQLMDELEKEEIRVGE